MKRQDHLRLIFKLKTLKALYKKDDYFKPCSLWYKYDDLYARATNLYIEKYGWNNSF